MRSRGGIVSAALAAQQPVTLFLSGPAGGVIGASFAAERSGVRDFVSLDMGGTCNDVAVVREGTPLPAEYHRLFERWYAFGFPAFAAVLAIFWLMIARPQLG